MIHTLIHQFGVFAWKKQRERGNRQQTNGERRKERSGEGGKEIRGRDCEPRRETYELFLVSSCVSHSVERGHW